MPLTYQNFDLLIESGASGGYRARVLTSPAGEPPPVAVRMPFSDLELENFLLRIGRPRRQSARGVQSEEAAAIQDFGGRLFDAVFHDQLRVALNGSVEQAEGQETGLRLRLRLTDCPELADLPWEYLYNTDKRLFPALSPWTPVVRYLDLPGRIRPLAVRAPLRILVMAASPTDFPALDVDSEWAKVRDALADLQREGRVSVDRVPTGTLGDLRRMLRRGEYHVFHFIGHGRYDPQARDGVLALEGLEGRAQQVTGADLGAMLHDHRSLRLGLLNSCEGARGGRTDPYSGTAQSLIHQGIPAVVAMQFEITDVAAITFAHSLYAAVADGYPLDAAVSEARNAIRDQPNPVEWATPVLYLRAPDGVIFDLTDNPGAAPSGRAGDRMVDEGDRTDGTGPDPDGSDGRARQGGVDRAPERSGPPTAPPTGAPQPDVGTPERRLSRRRAAVVVTTVVGLAAVATAAYLVLGNGSDGTGRGGSPTATQSGAVSSPGGPVPGLPAAAPLPADTMVVSRDVDDNIDLYLVDAATDAVGTRLTTAPVSEAVPLISPDRGSVVYLRAGEGGGDLPWVVASDGTGARKLWSAPPPECAGGVFQPAWDPVEPTVLAFSCSDVAGNRSLQLVDVGGQPVRELATPEPVVDDLTFSPDGQLVTFWAGQEPGDQGGSLWSVRADGSGAPVQLTDVGTGVDADPVWSPRGDQIAFRRDVGEESDIFVVAADGSGERALATRSGLDSDPTWSPDGGRLAFVSTPTAGAEPALWTMAADGSGQRRLLADAPGRLVLSAAWSRR